MAGKVRVKEGEMNVDEQIREMEHGALVFYSASYAPHVEFPTSYAGTQPPYQPIRDWVHRKWPDLGPGLKEAGLPAANTEQQKDNVAWVVVKAIAANGTDGVYFARKGLDTAKQAAPSIAAQYEGSNDPEAPKKIVAEVAETGFNKSQAVISQDATDTGNLLQSGSIELVEDPSELPDGEGP